MYLLAYHVDYWDRQGWKDRFSDAAFTQHQQQYAEWLHLNSVYTPQMVVNGKEEFVGSNEAALKKAITSAMKDSSSESLSLKASKAVNQVAVETTSGIPAVASTAMANQVPADPEGQNTSSRWNNPSSIQVTMVSV